MSQTQFETYLEKVDLEKLLKKLDPPDYGTLLQGVEHFSEKEAEKRDKIVFDYFGEEGITKIVDSVVRLFFSPPELSADSKILDVGAGSGFFTIRVMNKIHEKFPKTIFYAMDASPTMLSILSKKTDKIMSFIGIAENIVGSIEQAKKHFEMPQKFDAIISTLMLHHSSDIEKVFESFSKALSKEGKVVVIDLCQHDFKEFKKEMGDVHLGFDTTFIEETALKHFTFAQVEKMPGISCESSGRSAELFIAISAH
jgi:ubiquinone/menaquinone biosynthesis C-methylase UbiE